MDPFAAVLTFWAGLQSPVRKQIANATGAGASKGAEACLGSASLPPERACAIVYDSIRTLTLEGCCDDGTDKTIALWMPVKFS